MKVVTFLQEKGGVGKTTLAVHVAAGLAVRGARVMLVDADAQGTATASLGLPAEPGLYNLMIRNMPFRDAVRLVQPEIYEPPNDHSRGNLFMLPGNLETRLISEGTGDVFLLRKRLQELSSGIDFVVIDTPPTPSLLHSAIYIATDGIVYPTELEAFSFDGLMSSVSHREEFANLKSRMGWGDVVTLGIIPNKVRMNTIEHSENLKLLRSQYGDLVWEPLPLRITWAEAGMQRRTVFAYAPESAAAREAWAITDNLLQVVQS